MLMASIVPRLSIRNTVQILVIMPIVVPVILIAVGVFSLYAQAWTQLYAHGRMIIAHTALASTLCDCDRDVGIARTMILIRN